MSRKPKMYPVGMQAKSSNNFDDYRNIISEEFTIGNVIFRKRFTQGAYWTSLEKDLANQYFRDETWLFGIKLKDAIKFIDHGVDTETSYLKSVGFTPKNK